MKQVALTMSLLFCCLFSVKAQDKFLEEGYIIQNGDTIQGFIQRTDELALSHQIQFRKNLTSGPGTTYTPAEVDGFGFKSSNLYFSPVQLTLNMPSSQKKSWRFAKNLVRGELSLYKILISNDEQDAVSLKDSNHLYVVKKDSDYYTLGQYQIKILNRVGVDKKYLGMLRTLTSDCQNGQVTIGEDFELKDQRMIDLVKTYNACKSLVPSTTVYAYKVKAQIKHEVEASYSFISVNIKDKALYSHGYSIGYYWNITKPDFSRIFSERIGVNYLYFEHDNIENGMLGKEPVVSHHVRFPLQVEVNLARNSTASVVPFLIAGVTLQVLYVPKADYHDYEPYLGVGGGAYLNRFRISLSLDKGAFFDSNVIIYGLGLGYRLDRK